MCVHKGLDIAYTDYNEEVHEEHEPNDRLCLWQYPIHQDLSRYEMSKGQYGSDEKLPLIALFTPVVEDRNNPVYEAVVKVNIPSSLARPTVTGTCSSSAAIIPLQSDVLRPIYDRFIEELSRRAV